MYVDFLTAGKNKFSIAVDSADSSKETAVYQFSLDVIPTIVSLSVDEHLYWDDEVTFDASATEYNVTVADSLKTLTIHAVPTSEECLITYNGETSNEVDISSTNTIEITVSKDGLSNTYVLNIDKKTESNLIVITDPSDATVCVYDNHGVMLDANADGTYTAIFNKYKHTYTVTKNGYVTKNGVVPENGGSISVTLTKVLGEQPEEVESAWSNFRNSEYNMAITDARTPKNEDLSSVSPKWIKNFKEEAGNYPSVQIIVDNALVVMSGKTLYKIDLETGDVLQQAAMTAQPNYGYTPPTYAAGMIFCPLSGGIIQAFNAKTLESLWIYKDELGGQSLSPIAYSDGYIYTGFWNSEEKDGNFVCISIADEDVETVDEDKSATWKYKHAGGFYWAGSAAVGSAIIVGSDDGVKEGTTGSAKLYAFNKTDGSIISEITLSGSGDQRSSIAYDKANRKIYFTTKNGYLYSAKVNSSSGSISEVKSVKYSGQSTSTPVVYNGRVYFGLGNGFSEGYIVVADAGSLKEIFRIQLKGYPQSSVLLSNAYEAQSGYIYLYTTYNYKPGGISVIRVQPDCTKASDAKLTELYDAAGYSEYCIASVICGEDGTLYYKNDTGNVFAIGIPTYQNVINLIDEIGTVSLNSEGKISAARDAYNALSSSDQKKVTNIKNLTNAEAELEKLQEQAENASEVIELIKAIGKVTLNSKDAIEKAEKAYSKLLKAEKEFVTNYKTLTSARDTYDVLVQDAVKTVKELISDIGEVTLDSKSKISKARNAYDALPDYIQKLITNYSVLKAAEDAYEKLNEETVNNKTKTTSVSAKTTSTGKTITLTKSELLKMQDKLDAVDQDTSYEEALELLKTYYSLSEKQQLAFTDSENLELLKNIIAEENHEDTDTKIRVNNAEWNLRLVVEKQKNVDLEEEIEKKYSEGIVLGLWEIYLEDVLTGEKYQPEEMVEIMIPLKLVKEYECYDELSILHYGDEQNIEILNCEVSEGYLVFHTADFSYYAVIGSETIEEVTIAPTEKQNNLWMLWAALAGIGIGLIGVLIYFIIQANENEEEAKEDKR